jgi:transcriptional regulator with XRE-family HTH domain
MHKLDLTVVMVTGTNTDAGVAIRARQGTKIRRFRTLHALSQQALADKVGVTKAAVSDWERGNSTPRQHHQVALAKALDAPWSALFGLEGEAG